MHLSRMLGVSTEQLHQPVLQLREGVLGGVLQAEDPPGSLQYVVWDVEDDCPVHHPLLNHVVVPHHRLRQPEPGGCILLPECRQLHLVGDCMLHWPGRRSRQSSPLLQSQEPMNYPV